MLSATKKNGNGYIYMIKEAEIKGTFTTEADKLYMHNENKHL